MKASYGFPANGNIHFQTLIGQSWPIFD